MSNQKGIILVMTLLIVSVMMVLTMLLLERTLLMIKATEHFFVATPGFSRQLKQ